tara:strand:+ start:61 stop:198 length:138 start_codon:yes stop_codon:yes gene_type:complete
VYITPPLRIPPTLSIGIYFSLEVSKDIDRGVDIYTFCPLLKVIIF